MTEDENVPFSFPPNAWVERPPSCVNFSQDEVWRYMQAKPDTLLQAHRGWAFKEEGYVRNVRWNLSDDSRTCLVRCVCLPSMKKPPYTVSAWFTRDTGTVTGGICSCVAGKSGCCQHIVALLLSAEESCNTTATTSCTDVPCSWIVPAQAKKPAAPAPLADITFCKFLINKPTHQKKRRSYDPCERVPDPSPEDITKLYERLADIRPNLLCLRYGNVRPVKQARHTGAIPQIDDEQDLWSQEARKVVRHHMQTLPQLTAEERADIVTSTIGQACNQRWHSERLGRITASQFSAVIKCREPDYLVKRIMYPSQEAKSEALHYGRIKEPVAVAAYVALMNCRDDPVQVYETGLHVHPRYSFLGASPDRIIVKNGEEGLLEVKCPISKIGLTPEEACGDEKFCCALIDGTVQLKREHAFYYQVQGQMMVTGHRWCDFVFWTNNTTDANSTHIETVTLDEEFVGKELLPGLLYFAEHALFPEVITKRIQRHKDLARGKYVSFKKFRKGTYRAEDGPGLKKTIRKLK
ncbi:unnamed protein product [Ixodes pacificus]